MVATEYFVPKVTLWVDTRRIAGPGVMVAMSAIEVKSSQLSKFIKRYVLIL